MVIIGISTRNLENKPKGQKLKRIGPQFLDGLFLLGFLWAAKLKLFMHKPKPKRTGSHLHRCTVWCNISTISALRSLKELVHRLYSMASKGMPPKLSMHHYLESGHGMEEEIVIYSNEDLG
jgi:hypothetical protein